MSSTVHVQRGGCVTAILWLIVLWALAFGVTYKGVHHGISCSCERGVGLE